MIKKLFLSIITTLVVSTSATAQTMEATKMSASPMDLSASVNKRLDFNGQPCALIKVSITASNATFGGNIVGDVQRDGADYWVYVTAGTKMLQIKHPNYKTLMVSFPDMGIKRVEGKQTYILDINLPYYAPSPAVAEASAPMGATTPAVASNKSKPSEEYGPNEPRKFKKHIVKNSTELFFPLNGITLGKTTASEALKLGFNKDDSFWDKYRLIKTDENVSFWTNWVQSNADKETYCRIQFDGAMPRLWRDKFNIEFDMSYNEWLDFFKSIGFRIDISKEPTVGEYKGRDVLRAAFRATSPDGKYYFNLNFDYGNKGASLYSPATLTDIEMIAPANNLIAKKLASSKGASKGVKPSSSIDLFFPVYGITLGKTTWKEMADAGFGVTFYDEESVTSEALGLAFWDHDLKKYFNQLYITNSSNMPVDWVKLGFQWGNSYDTWVNLLKDLGFTLQHTKQPDTSKSEFSAKFTAISPDGRLSMRFQFDYGKNGNSTTSPGTLYCITMYAN